ncbi:KilA-N domain-containing protein [Rhodoferax sp. U11-2br]|nr:KilA-N domain-containing protein [Rhodoferax sp. U11-2br]
MFFARWLDVRFAVWCDSMIDDMLKGNAEVYFGRP